MIALDERALKVLELVPPRTRTRAWSGSPPTWPDDCAPRWRGCASCSRAPAPRRPTRTRATTCPAWPPPPHWYGWPRLYGADFDQLVLASLRAHFDQCLMLAGSEQSAGSDRSTKDFARLIESTRRAQLAALPAQVDSRRTRVGWKMTDGVCRPACGCGRAAGAPSRRPSPRRAGGSWSAGAGIRGRRCCRRSRPRPRPRAPAGPGRAGPAAHPRPSGRWPRTARRCRGAPRTAPAPRPRRWTG